MQMPLLFFRMDNLQEIEGENGLFKINKVKVMYLLGWNSLGVYMLNLVNNKVKFKEDK